MYSYQFSCRHLEFKEKLSLRETFIGTSDKVAFESCSWSPLGFASDGGCLLLVGVHSDLSVHFKVVECVCSLGSLSAFKEIVSLMECLRDQWFMIPLYDDGRVFPITDRWPSISLILEDHVQPSFVSWSNEFFVTAWGCLVFLWQARTYTCIGACTVPGCDMQNVPLREVVVSSFSNSVQIACKSTRGKCTTCHVDPTNFKVTYTFPSNLPQVVCLSPSGVLSYTFLRTQKCVQILQTVQMDSWNGNWGMDVLWAIGALYKPRNEAVQILDLANSFGSVLGRFGGLVKCDLGSNALAFALHHSHCSRIESHPQRSARIAEKRDLLHQLGINVSKPVNCLQCKTICTVDANFQRVQCDKGHIFPLIVDSMQIATSDDTWQCCFCGLLTHSTKIDKCRHCTIGILCKV